MLSAVIKMFLNHAHTEIPESYQITSSQIRFVPDHQCFGVLNQFHGAVGAERVDDSSFNRYLIQWNPLFRATET